MYKQFEIRLALGAQKKLKIIVEFSETVLAMHNRCISPILYHSSSQLQLNFLSQTQKVHNDKQKAVPP